MRRRSAASRRGSLAWIAGPLVIGGVALLAVGGAGAATPAAVAPAQVAGSQGTDTALPPTPSQRTLTGRGAFSGLSVTVNQTEQLTNQTVSITWTGGTPTRSGPGRFGQHYLQIMQCWGDDDGSVPGNPGPPPEQCVQGAVAGTYGGLPGGLYPSGFALSRVISRTTWANYDPAVGFADPTTNVWMPFRPVAGEVVNAQSDPNFNPSVQGGNFWLNPFFNIITTNEIPGAVTGEDGRGSELFQVNTGVESSGLGCGQKKQAVAGGGNKVPTCWIVVVPRGSAADENVGTPFETTPDQFGVATSPLSPNAWKNRIAFPLTFNPVDSPCTLGADEARISGSELALPAVASWQPSLCSSGKQLPPFAFAPVGDAAARQQITSGVDGGPGMVIVSKPLGAEANTPESPAVYAPLGISGLTVGFNFERNPKPSAPPEAQTITGVRVAEMRLTPRLVAKLLTQSYTAAVTIQVAPSYPWLASNPQHLAADPDFTRFNPEFEQFDIADARTFSSLQIPAGNSDAIQQVWEWILADPEAKAWMAGTPDEWGMKVNPVYATVASANSTGIAFGDPLPSSFPKADPYCYQGPDITSTAGAVTPPALCGTDWVPYTRGFADSARIARYAADGARIVLNPFALAPSEAWNRELPQFLGRRGMLVLTDTPSAAQYGLQSASLSRAGDNGATRSFIAPTVANLQAGAAAMKARTEPKVLEPTPTAEAPGAYPLTSLVYGVVKPLQLSTSERGHFASFIEYAAGAGQVPGFALGQLPRGFAPLSSTLKSQALVAAGEVREIQAPATTTTTAPPVTTVDSGGGGSEGGGGLDGGGGFGGGFDGGGGFVDGVDDTTPPLDTTAPSTETTAVSVPSDTSAPVDSVPVDATSTTVATTPRSNVAGTRYTLPGLGMVALGSALGALEITKRPRRGGASPAEALGSQGQS